MATEHTPVFPGKTQWPCTCGMINDYHFQSCIQCGKQHIVVLYSNPCDRCGLCGDRTKTKINCDFLVRDNVAY